MDTYSYSRFLSRVKKSLKVAAVLAMFHSGAAMAQGQLLVIEATQFYPAGGYPSAVGSQNIPGGYQELVFRADSGQFISGQLTIRCRGGREFRNAGLVASPYGESIVRNPCQAENQVNFDLYLSSPNMSLNRYDRVRVYGRGYLPPSNGGGGGGGIDPDYGFGSLIRVFEFNQFFPAQGYMAIGGLEIPGGFSVYNLRSTERGSAVAGQLTIRCRGGREYRNVAILQSGPRTGYFSNPCSITSGLNIDIYLSSPRVGAGTFGQIRLLGKR